MQDDIREVLLLDQARLAKLKAEIESKLNVVQEVTPRMVVVEGDPASIRSAVEAPGVEAVEEAGSAALSHTEKLFLDAWNEQKHTSKARSFEGFSWGTKGFDAP